MKQTRFSFASQLRILLGTVLLSILVNLCMNGVFNPTLDSSSFSVIVQNLLTKTKSHIAQPILHLALMQSRASLLISILTLTVTAGALILGVFKRSSIALSGVIFSLYFLAHAGVRGTWLFEFVLPAGFSWILLYHTLKSPNTNRSDLATLSWPTATLVIVTYALFVFWVIHSSVSPQSCAMSCALWTSSATAALLGLNRARGHGSSPFQSTQNEFNLISYCALLIGLMLIAQVRLDYLLGWFTESGYSGLIANYEQYSRAPYLLRMILPAVQNNVGLFMPIQLVIETCLAFCLVTRLFQPIVSTASLGLFALLAIIEFGVPDAMPIPGEAIHTTWSWELMLTACVMALVAYHQWRDSRGHYAPFHHLVGASLHNYTGFFKRSIWAVTVALIWTTVIMLSHNHNNIDNILSITVGLMILCLCLIMQVIDYLRMTIRQRH